MELNWFDKNKPATAQSMTSSSSAFVGKGQQPPPPPQTMHYTQQPGGPRNGKDPLGEDFATLVGMAGVSGGTGETKTVLKNAGAASSSTSFFGAGPAAVGPPSMASASSPGAQPWGAVTSGGAPSTLQQGGAVQPSPNNNAAAGTAATSSKFDPATRASGQEQSQSSLVTPGIGSLWNSFFGGASSSNQASDKKKKSKPKTERELSAVEAEASIQQAVGAKKNLVSSALREKVKQAEAERRRLARLDAQMQLLDATEQREIAVLRAQVEQSATKISILSKEAETKKAILEKATQDYVDISERLQDAQSEKKELEESLVDMILQSGKKKDEQLNNLLCEIEAEERSASAAAATDEGGLNANNKDGAPAQKKNGVGSKSKKSVGAAAASAAVENKQGTGSDSPKAAPGRASAEQP
ncbi:unnamed protein product [Amoebophrya sp. A120]|nr:unnamed protein product [Amoebophrya sp. A120]|eukprot:GSA120T00018397001.1